MAGSGVRSLSHGIDVFDLHVVDRLVDLAGVGARSLSYGIDVFDMQVVDRLGGGVGDAVKGAGRLIRPIQSGRVQNYLLLASLAALVLLAASVVILSLRAL